LRIGGVNGGLRRSVGLVSDFALYEGGTGHTSRSSDSVALAGAGGAGDSLAESGTRSGSVMAVRCEVSNRMLGEADGDLV
jgi:hypothetical protein